MVFAAELFSLASAARLFCSMRCRCSGVNVLPGAGLEAEEEEEEKKGLLVVGAGEADAEPEEGRDAAFFAGEGVPKGLKYACNVPCLLMS